MAAIRCALRRRRHRWWPRWLRRRALRRRRRAQRRARREARRSAAPACTSAASRPRSCSRPRRCSARSATRGEFGVDAGEPTLDLVGHHGPQADDHRPAHQRPRRPCSRAARSPCSTVSARSAPNRTVHDQRRGIGRRRGRRRRHRDPRGRLRAPHDPRLRGRRSRRRHLRRAPVDRRGCRRRLRSSAGARSGASSRRLLADLGSRGHDPRGPAQDPARLRRRRRPRSSRAPSRSGASTSVPACGSTGHDPGDAGDDRAGSATATTLDVELVVVSVGRRPFADLLGLDGTGVAVDERGFVVVDELLPHRRVDGRVRRRRPHRHAPARPRRLRRGRWWSIRTSSVSRPLPIDYDRVPWCIYCHPEVAFVGHTERAATRGRLRRRRLEASLRRQRSGDDRRRDRRHGQGDRREARPTAPAAGSSASTWSGPGSPSSSVRATWP